jgi:uncharacterized protein (DUF305 family)
MRIYPSECRAPLLACIAACSLTFVSACDDDDDPAAGDDRSLVGDRRVPLTPDDELFVDFFIPHHEDAVMMAQMVVERGEREDVKQMARMIIQVQTAELERMRAVRNELTGSEEAPAVNDPHMDADMERMRSMSGAELDEMFMEEMIAHHGAALPTAKRARTSVSREDLREMAEKMFEAQAKEIAELHAMRMGPDQTE